MTILYRLLALARWLFRRNEIERALDADLHDYVERSAAEKIRSGMTEAQARRAARIELGGIEQTKERVRATLALGPLERGLADARYALRTMRRQKMFTVVAISILGLGVGTATTIFSVVNSVLLRPLPYPDPQRLVAVTSVFRPENSISPEVSRDDMTALREKNHTIESVGGFTFTRVPVRVGDTAYLPDTAMVYPGLFTALGTPPAIGTSFDLDSATNGPSPTVIISHAFWQRAFAGSADVIGQPIFVAGEPLTVRGVLPADFELPRPDSPLYRAPVDLFRSAGQTGPSRGLWGIARLRPGVTLAQARAEVSNMDIDGDDRGSQKRSLRLSSLAEERTIQSRQSLAIFPSIAAVLFLIACVNLMNLLLSRSAARIHEMAIRKAIGGTPGRLLRQQLTESACLFLLGGLAGLGMAAVAVRFVEALSPLHLPITRGVTIDGTVLLFTLVVCVSASILTGIVPAVVSSVVSTAGQRKGSAAGTSSRAFPRMQTGLSVVQIGLCVGLLAAAGVLGHSLWRLNTIDPGFRRSQVLGFQITLPGPTQTWGTFVSRALEELQRIPGIRQAGFITLLPPDSSSSFANFRFDGPAPEGVPSQGQTRAETLMTSADYFETVGMSVVRGRGFLSTDTAESRPVAIVNEAFVRMYFPDDKPLGRRIFSRLDPVIGGEEKAREIVGIVNDTRDRGLRNEPLPIIYLPFRQVTFPWGAFALRTEVTPTAIIPEIRRRLRAIDRDVPLVDFETLGERVYESLKEPRFYALLAVSCALMAVLFVTVGIYGVVSYAVSRRTLEFGIRMALGSSAGGVLRNVLAHGIRMALLGTAFGILLAVAITRLLESFGFVVKPIDIPAFGASIVIAFAVTLFAAYVPARRAYRQSPMTALRYE
jgi:predicted permease